MYSQRHYTHIDKPRADCIDEDITLQLLQYDRQLRVFLPLQLLNHTEEDWVNLSEACYLLLIRNFRSVVSVNFILGEQDRKHQLLHIIPSQSGPLEYI